MQDTKIRHENTVTKQTEDQGSENEFYSGTQNRKHNFFFHFNDNQIQ